MIKPASSPRDRVRTTKAHTPPEDADLVWIEPGSFRMGSNTGGSEGGPAHEVQLTHGYWMARFPVMEAEYRRFVEATARLPMMERRSRPAGDRWPAVYVGWGDAVAFCVWLTETEKCAGRLPRGFVYRLPTEAEWEYAARGGNRSLGYAYSGSNNLDEVGWYDGNSGNKTHPVGRKKANELGLHDMSGNVWEWCQDWYDAEYYERSPALDPTGPPSGSSRVFRGGSWRRDTAACQVTNRLTYTPSCAGNYLGFRVVLARQGTVPVMPARVTAGEAVAT
jgi:formylglycine-generating enzyme required for sulfatase activity